MGIYLADIFDNLLLLHEVDGTALLDPIPVVPRPMPPVIPGHTEPNRDDATVYLQDIHAGKGPGGRAAGYREAIAGDCLQLRIRGAGGATTRLVSADRGMLCGSSEPVGRRGWFGPVPHPGQHARCFPGLGCRGKSRSTHADLAFRSAGRTPVVRGLPRTGGHGAGVRPLAGAGPIAALTGSLVWPAAPASTLREKSSQCSIGTVSRAMTGARDGAIYVPRSSSRIIAGDCPGGLDLNRLRNEHRSLNGGRIRLYPGLRGVGVPYIRRVNVGDDVSLLTPGYYHADTSELVQLLQKGHHGIAMEREAWERLTTWIDLNGPCHGTWRDVFNVPLPDCADQRRRELYQLYGGPPDDPESVVSATAYDETPVVPAKPTPRGRFTLPDWPFDGGDPAPGGRRYGSPTPGLGRRHHPASGQDPRRAVRDGRRRGNAGRTAAHGRGDWRALLDERWRDQQPAVSTVLWTHDSGFYTKRHKERTDDRGMFLGGSSQPAIKVSWNEVMAFCRCLSERTGRQVTLSHGSAMGVRMPRRKQHATVLRRSRQRFRSL